MNFIRDTFPVAKRKRKTPFSQIKDINFFQTVREGSRNYHARKSSTGANSRSKGSNTLSSSSGSSFVGRTFIRPARKTSATFDSSVKGTSSSVLSILGGEDKFCKPAPPSDSSKPLTAEGSFYSHTIGSPPSKRSKPQDASVWTFSGGNANTVLSSGSSTPVASDRSHQEHIPLSSRNKSMFIEETAKKQCSEFRKSCHEDAVQEGSFQNTSLYIEETAEEQCNQFRKNYQETAGQEKSLQNTCMYIEETAEIKCSQFRAGMQKLKIHSGTVIQEHKNSFFEIDCPDKTTLMCTPNARVSSESPSIQPSPPNEPSVELSTPNRNKDHYPVMSDPVSCSSQRQLNEKCENNILTPTRRNEEDVCSLLYARKSMAFSMSPSPETPKKICSASEISPYKSTSPGVQLASKGLSCSNADFLLNNPEPAPQDEPTNSSSLNTKKCFFSDIVSDTGVGAASSSKTESFFKIPELPSGSTSNNYEALFSTPGRMNTLPRIETPKLFTPYTKSTPSRPTPTQSKSSVKTPQAFSNESFYVISLTEGRGHAMCEVGIAAIDLNHPVLHLSQFSDSQTYKKTLANINAINPAEMIIPDTFKGSTPSVIYKTVTETFQDMRVITVKRQHFSAKQGLDAIRSLLLPDCSSVEMIIHRKYYTLAASDALLKYIEIKHGIIIAPKSLKVNYQSAKNIVAIDLETCQRLELVMANAEMICPEKYSLFGLLNHTKTMGGKRRLRVSLLQPSSSIDVIKERQNSVTALVNDQRSLASLQANLLKFSNVERLLWLCLKTPDFKNESKTFETFTNYILLLKESLESIPHLRTVLHDIDNDHIINIRDELSDNRYDSLLARIHKMIKEEARPARGHAESERQRCFAIKDGINDLLDVARATYSDLIQQVMDNISELSREYSLPLKMVQTADLGFHSSYLLPKGTTFEPKDLPEIFTEVKLKNRTVHLLTEELYIYNMRIKRAMQEIQLITNVVIYDLIESLQEEVSLLYRLCEHVSDLDMLACIAQLSSSPDFTKPVFGEETSLVGVRHPILDHIRPTKPIPNNVFASKKKNFNIITGPNMGGKTVYVLMIPLIQIMAQIGCYVPADKAEIRITDHIYVKKGSGDSIECGLSSFSKEIKELNYALENMTDRSLIILDEICTGTDTDEGTALAWGYCEEFLRRPVFTFLTTHYHYLTNLSKIYKNVTNYNMEAIERDTNSTEDSGLTFTYRLLPGVTTTTNYGLRLMMSSGLPTSIKKNALEIAEDILKNRAAALPLVIPESPKTAGLHSRCEKLETFMSNLYGLSMTDNFTTEIIRTLQRMAIEEILTEEVVSDDDDEIQEAEKEEEEARHHEKDTVQDSSQSKIAPVIQEEDKPLRDEPQDSRKYNPLTSASESDKLNDIKSNSPVQTANPLSICKQLDIDKRNSSPLVSATLPIMSVPGPLASTSGLASPQVFSPKFSSSEPLISGRSKPSPFRPKTPLIKAGFTCPIRANEPAQSFPSAFSKIDQPQTNRTPEAGNNNNSLVNPTASHIDISISGSFAVRTVDAVTIEHDSIRNLAPLHLDSRPRPPSAGSLDRKDTTCFGGSISPKAVKAPGSLVVGKSFSTPRIPTSKESKSSESSSSKDTYS